DQAERVAALAGPEEPGEKVVVLGKLCPAALLHKGDEGLVYLFLERLQALDILFLFRLERIEDGLVAAGGMDPALHADLLDEFLEAEPGGDNADRAHDRGGIGDDLVSRKRDHVAARGRHVFDEDVDPPLLLFRKVADALVDE